MKLTMKFWTSLLLLQFFVADETIWTYAEGIPSLTKCGKVHLTISSLPDNYLEMNWITKCDTLEEAPDIIALYGQDPRTANRPLQSINAHNYDGYFKTSIEFRWAVAVGKDYSENETRSIAGGNCFDYWIASVKRNRIIDSNCLKVQPTWMDDNRSILGPQRIGSIFIPGTHNSGAYGVTFLHDIIRDFILNQNTNIWAQLVFGIRYLDLRIGYYENEGFFINHDLIRIRRLEPELRAIRKFLELAPKEVVIIDFHRFPYPTIFTNDMHRKLIDVVNRELGHLALPPSGLQVGKGPTLNEIWQYNKSLIICYGQRQIAKEYPWLWSPLQQYWGDKQNAPDLKTYLQASIKSHNTITNPLWALMAELTISPIDVLFNSASNYQLADKVNRKLTKWFRDEWAKDANIVATDYFLGNDLVNIAIEANKLR